MEFLQSYFLMYFSLFPILLHFLNLERVLSSIEKIALRRQILIYKSRRKKRFRLSSLERFHLFLVSLIHPGWRNFFSVISPDTVVAWHRKGFRQFWNLISRKKKNGRPRIRSSTVEIIRKLKRDNPSWGPIKIQGELNRLGIEVSLNTIRKYLREFSSPGRRRSWREFLKNHREYICSMDFFTVPSWKFSVLYCFFVMDHSRRKILHVGVTEHPHLLWVKNQLRKAFPGDEDWKYKILISDNDPVFKAASSFIKDCLGLRHMRIPPGCPWLNGVAERWVKTVRTELVDRIIPLNEDHLLRLLREYVKYYNTARPHMTLGSDAPMGRERDFREEGSRILKIPWCGGLQNSYSWRKLAS